MLAKAKEMQSGNFAMSSLKEEVNKLAYENLQKGKSCSNLVIDELNPRFASFRTEEGSAGASQQGVRVQQEIGFSSGADGSKQQSLVG